MTVDAPARQPAFAEAVSLVFRTARKDATACLALVAPYAFIVGLFDGLMKSVTLVVGPSAVTVSEVAVTGVAIFAALAIFLVINVIAYPLTVGGLSVIGSAEVYGDVIETTGIRRRVIDKAVDAIAAFLLAVLFLGVAPFAIGVVSTIVAAVVSPVVGFAFLIFAFAIVVVPEIYAAVRLSLAVPVVIREGLKPRAALRRSWGLVHGTRWVWVFGVNAIVAAVAVVVYLVVSALAGRLHASGLFEFVVYLVFGAAEAAFTMTLLGVTTGVVYASLAAETAHAPAEVGAHEVLPSELPPLQHRDPA